MKNLIENSSSIVIVSHKNPDGDAIGSSLALFNYLKKFKKQSTVILPDSFPAYYNWLCGSDGILIADKQMEKAKQEIANAELIFCLDFNDLTRLGELGPFVEKAKAVKVMIDHHQNPKDFAGFKLHRVKACSTAQLIYEFIESNGHIDLVDEFIGECIYTGLITDSGSFKYSSVESKTHLIAADLIDRGLNHTKVHELIFDQNNLSRLHLLGYALGKIQVLDNYPVAFMVLSSKDLKQFNFSKGDTEGLVNYCLSIKGVEVAAFLKEDAGIVKMSFRSKGTIRVNDFASKYFSGGGHINAAGGRSELPIEQAVNQFTQSIKLFLND